MKEGSENKVYRLKNVLCGLRQTPRAWYSRIDAYFMKEGFKKCPHEHTLYTKSDENMRKLLIVSLYVDDLIYTSNDTTLIIEFRSSMQNEFDMSDLGRMRYFLGVEVIQCSKGIFIHQQKYVNEVLDRFGLKECKAVSSPVVTGCKLSKNYKGNSISNTVFKQIVGSLMYLNATRSDVMFGVSLISRFMENPSMGHLTATKRILRYLKGSSDTRLLYKRRKTRVDWVL